MDAERTVCTHLHGMIGVPVHYDVPGDRPPEFATVELVGGSTDSLGIGAKSVLVQCWAGSRKGAAETAERAKAVLRTVSERDGVFGSRITSEYRDRDADSGAHRRCLLVELYVSE